MAQIGFVHIHSTILATLLMALTWIPSPVAAQAAESPELELLAAYPYDTTAGWQEPCYEFHQPSQSGLGVMLRVRTNGYHGLRDLQFRVVAATPTGEEVARRVEHQRLPAGEFEFLIEDIDLFTDAFSSGLYELTLSTEWSGSPAIVRQCDVSVIGLPVPLVKFSNLRITNPARKQNLARFFPGDEIVLEGEVAVDSNPTSSLPVLYVISQMEHDGNQLDISEPPMITALNWGRLPLDAPAGVWHFTVHGSLPAAYPVSPDGNQPFRVVVALRWTASAVVKAEVHSEVLDPGLGFEETRVPVERLIVLQPAWEWDVATGPSLPVR